jgi:hypothetical protein
MTFTEAGADQRFTNFLQIEAIGQGLLHTDHYGYY